jgi:hypothetical protein
LIAPCPLKGVKKKIQKVPFRGFRGKLKEDF